MSVRYRSLISIELPTMRAMPPYWLQAATPRTASSVNSESLVGARTPNVIVSG